MRLRESSSADVQLRTVQRFSFPLIKHYTASSTEVSETAGRVPTSYLLVVIYCRMGSVYPLNCTNSPTAAVDGSAAGPSLFLINVSQNRLDCGQLAFRIPRAAQISRLLQLFSAPQALPCCVGLCFLIFSVSAYSYRSKPCTLMLCFSARRCYCSIYRPSHLSLVIPSTSMTLHLQLFFSISSFSFNLFEVFWDTSSSALPEVSVWRAVFQHQAAPSALLHLRPGVAFSVGRHK